MGTSSASTFDPNASAVMPNSASVAQRTASDPATPTRPIEQNVTLKVRAEEAKTITQPVALDVKFAKQPTLEVPVSLSLTAPSEAERKIPVSVAFTVDSRTPITVPIRFQPEPVQLSMVNRGVVGTGGDGTNNATGSGSGTSVGGDSGGPSLRNISASYAYDPSLIPFRLLAGVIAAAGLVGGILRTIQSRRNSRRAVTLERNWSQLSFEERVRAIEQQSESTNLGERMLMLFANVLWGILAASLVPAALVLRGHPLLIQISESRAHLLALFGFCLLAATLGAELIVLAQRLLQRALERPSHDTSWSSRHADESG